MSNTTQDCVIVRYAEIALKRGNRRMFEEQLIKNIKAQLKHNEVEYERVYRVSGRIIVNTQDHAAPTLISNVFGVSSTSPALKVKPEIELMKDAALKAFNKAKPKPKSFRITATRLVKKVGYTSQQLNEQIGQCIVDETGCRVNLKKAGLDIGIEAAGYEAYLHTERIEGVSGLPVGVSGKILVFLSGGIDSPVAAWLCMRRGCEVTLLHFLHEDEKTKTPGKIKSIADKLRQYHPKINLFIVPASGIERELIMNVPAEYRIIVLRRIFLKIAGLFCENHAFVAVASGDNIGQVASQTLENLSVINKAAPTLFIRPLACFNKQEIVDLAKRIGTYDASIEQYMECCNFLVPRHPSTKADEEVIDELESRITDETVKEAFKNSFLVK